MRKANGRLDANFVEGMVCSGGCIAGAGTLQKFGMKKDNIDTYAKATVFNSIKESIDN